MSTTAVAAPPLSGRAPIYSSLFAQVVAALVLGIILGMATPDFAISLKIGRAHV
jgi:aerobic C4-dicarboxylate transport protein